MNAKRAKTQNRPISQSHPDYSLDENRTDPFASPRKVVQGQERAHYPNNNGHNSHISHRQPSHYSGSNGSANGVAGGHGSSLYGMPSASNDNPFPGANATFAAQNTVSLDGGYRGMLPQQGDMRTGPPPSQQMNNRPVYPMPPHGQSRNAKGEIVVTGKHFREPVHHAYQSNNRMMGHPQMPIRHYQPETQTWSQPQQTPLYVPIQMQEQDLHFRGYYNGRPFIQGQSLPNSGHVGFQQPPPQQPMYHDQPLPIGVSPLRQMVSAHQYPNEAASPITPHPDANQARVENRNTGKHYTTPTRPALKSSHLSDYITRWEGASGLRTPVSRPPQTTSQQGGHPGTYSYSYSPLNSQRNFPERHSSLQEMNTPTSQGKSTLNIGLDDTQKRIENSDTSLQRNHTAPQDNGPRTFEPDDPQKSIEKEMPLRVNMRSPQGNDARTFGAGHLQQSIENETPLRLKTLPPQSNSTGALRADDPQQSIENEMASGVNTPPAQGDMIPAMRSDDSQLIASGDEVSSPHSSDITESAPFDKTVLANWRKKEEGQRSNTSTSFRLSSPSQNQVDNNSTGHSDFPSQDLRRADSIRPNNFRVNDLADNGDLPEDLQMRNMGLRSSPDLLVNGSSGEHDPLIATLPISPTHVRTPNRSGENRLEDPWSNGSREEETGQFAAALSASIADTPKPNGRGTSNKGKAGARGRRATKETSRGTCRGRSRSKSEGRTPRGTGRGPGRPRLKPQGSIQKTQSALSESQEFQNPAIDDMRIPPGENTYANHLRRGFRSPTPRQNHFDYDTPLTPEQPDPFDRMGRSKSPDWSRDERRIIRSAEEKRDLEKARVKRKERDDAEQFEGLRNSRGPQRGWNGEHESDRQETIRKNNEKAAAKLKEEAQRARKENVAHRPTKNQHVSVQQLKKVSQTVWTAH